LLSYGNAIEQGDTAIVRGHQLTNDDLIRRSVIQDIMCYGEVDIPRVEQAFSIHFPHYFERELAHLASLEEDGLLKTTSTQLTLTPAGRLLMRHVALAFDAYQGQHSMHAYSKVV
jgi:oxygen-independent coproporphyrinogen-3 oxidase